MVVLDDFYGWLKYSQLLNLLDRYPMQVEVKGAKREFLAKEIIITSNKSPVEWYDSEKVDIAPLLRRLDLVKYFDFSCGVFPVAVHWDLPQTFYEFSLARDEACLLTAQRDQGGFLSRITNRSDCDNRKMYCEQDKSEIPF